MKALFVHDHVFLKDAERCYSNKLDYEVFRRYLRAFSSLTVFARARPTDVVDGLSEASGPGVSFFFGPNIRSSHFLFHIYKTRKRLAELVSRHDLIIARLPSEFGMLVVNEANRQKKPLVVEVVGCARDSLWFHGNPLGKPYALIQSFRMRVAVSAARNVVYVSEKYLQNRYPPSPKANVANISNVRLSDLNEANLNRKIEFLRRPKSVVIIGCIGSLRVRYKGFEFLCQSLAKLQANKDFGFELRFAGDGTSEEFSNIVELYGLTEHIRFYGRLSAGEEINSWLDKLDVYVQPSFTEGLPRALIEAMARGCPAVVSNAGGMPDIINPRFVHKAGDTAGFISALMSVVPLPVSIETARDNFKKSLDYNERVLEERRTAFLLRAIQESRFDSH